jgi:hypothetical protein
MAKKESPMTSLEMPGFGVAMMGKPSDMGPEYPCLRIRSKEEIELPEGDFFFLAIGHVKRKEDIEEDDGSHCYCYELEVHAIQPIQEIADEKVIEKAPGKLEDDFDAAADKMINLKEEDDSKDEPEDDSDDEDY